MSELGFNIPDSTRLSVRPQRPEISWHYRKNRTFSYFVILDTLDQIGLADRATMEAYSGYGRAWCCQLLCALLELGLVERPHAGRYRLTERGKIALALAAGKRARKRLDA